jgi:uncharacterized protein YbjT (DUF2867 family)
VTATAADLLAEGRAALRMGHAATARDVGTAAATILTEDGHEGKTCVLTGPVAITFDEIAGHLSRATGRVIEFVSVPDEVARRAMVASGMPEWFADNIATVFGRLRDGVAARPTDTVALLVGGRPRSFGDFAREHAGIFAG